MSESFFSEKVLPITRNNMVQFEQKCVNPKQISTEDLKTFHDALNDSFKGLLETPDAVILATKDFDKSANDIMKAANNILKFMTHKDLVLIVGTLQRSVFRKVKDRLAHVRRKVKDLKAEKAYYEQLD